MNKTRKRAMQKHRAKQLKFEVRRKTDHQETPVAAAPARQKPAVQPRASKHASDEAVAVAQAEE